MLKLARVTEHNHRRFRDAGLILSGCLGVLAVMTFINAQDKWRGQSHLQPGITKRDTLQHHSFNDVGSRSSNFSWDEVRPASEICPNLC